MKNEERFLCGKNKKKDEKSELPLGNSLVSGKRDSNSRPQPWQGCALPTELFPQNESEEEETRTPTSQLTLPPQSSASTNSATSPFFVVVLLSLADIRGWISSAELLLLVESSGSVPRTGLEPARRETLAPETSASTIPPPGLEGDSTCPKVSGKRDSNSRPQPWQGCALPTELFPRNRCPFQCRSVISQTRCKVTTFFDNCKGLRGYF